MLLLFALVLPLVAANVESDVKGERILDAAATDRRDGAWGPWTEWSACSAPCGDGSRSRSRLCNNPPPSRGGATCSGSACESQLCNLKKCPSCTTANYQKSNGMCACGVQLERGLTWLQANDRCRAIGARLPVIMNKAENDEIFRIKPAFTGQFADGMWLGANDIGHEGSFVWADPPSPVTYTNWHAGQPDNSGGIENCVHMWQGEDNWNDGVCNGSPGGAPQATICEVLFPCKN